MKQPLIIWDAYLEERFHGFLVGQHLRYRYSHHPVYLRQVQVAYITILNILLQSLFVYWSEFLDTLNLKKWLLRIMDQIWQLMDL